MRERIEKTPHELLLDIGRAVGNGFTWPRGTKVETREVGEGLAGRRDVEWSIRIPDRAPLCVVFSYGELEDSKVPTRVLVADRIARRLRESFSN